MMVTCRSCSFVRLKCGKTRSNIFWKFAREMKEKQLKNNPSKNFRSINGIYKMYEFIVWNPDLVDLFPLASFDYFTDFEMTRWYFLRKWKCCAPHQNEFLSRCTDKNQHAMRHHEYRKEQQNSPTAIKQIHTVHYIIMSIAFIIAVRAGQCIRSNYSYDAINSLATRYYLQLQAKKTID